MQEKQTINCTVESCIYHNGKEEKCTLKSIEVKPKQNVQTKKPDESMCASYKCDE